MLGKWKGKTGQKPEKDVYASDSVYVCVCVGVSVGVSVGGIGCNAKHALVLTGIGKRLITFLFIEYVAILF